MFLFAIGYPVAAQDFVGQFKQLFDKQDFAAQEKLLKKWEAAKPDDPELYVSYFNYYFRKSRRETLGLTPVPPKGESLRVTKDDDKKVVVYLGSNVSFDKADLDLGISYIDKGITKFPDRLDMRFGKTYALGQINDYERFKGEIIRAIDYFDGGKIRWLWRDNKPLDQSKDFMLKSIQDYIVQLFDAGDQNTQFIKPISEAALKYFPDHVESLSNLSVVHMINGKFDDALLPLKKAEKIAPNDQVIIGNIAFCYYNKHDKANATVYYERLAKVGDDRARSDAAIKLAEIKGWK